MDEAQAANADEAVAAVLKNLLEKDADYYADNTWKFTPRYENRSRVATGSGSSRWRRAWAAPF